jgi:hypothetical protein
MSNPDSRHGVCGIVAENLSKTFKREADVAESQLPLSLPKSLYLGKCRCCSHLDIRVWRAAARRSNNEQGYA